MSKSLLDAIARRGAEEDEARLVYADALEEEGEAARADFVRLHLAMRDLEPDDVRWTKAEADLSRLRRGIADASWLDVIEPERAPLRTESRFERGCDCFELVEEDEDDELDGDDDEEEEEEEEKPYVLKREPVLHREVQDTECDGWKRLVDEVEAAAVDRRTQFSPMQTLSREEVAQIVTLPKSIAKLTSVRTLTVYGSQLVRIPPEIGAMTSLESFTPYTSYRLHWFPYEITRCLGLRSSTVSTRALYGNYKMRWPFPRLAPSSRPPRAHGQLETRAVRNCSVCDAPFLDEQRHRVWITRLVASDVLPLLVNACSEACVASLPPGHEGYVATPHRGGPDVTQPKRRF